MKKNIMKIIIKVTTLLFFISCQPINRISENSIIRTEYEVLIYNDSSLNSKSLIEGYVYSKEKEVFIKDATIVFVNSNPPLGTITDYNGYFKSFVTPGTYSITSAFIGHKTIKTKEINIEKGQRTIVYFNHDPD